MPSTPPTSRLRHATLVSTTAIALGLMLSGCKKDESAPPSGPRTVLVSPATPGASTAPEFIGEVRAKQRAELAFAMPGVVRQVLVEAGDAVKQGQLLATLETTPSQAQLSAITADIQRLQANAEEARRKRDRMVAARERHAASEAEWTAAQTELRMAEAALANAQAQREGTAWTRAQSELRAPFNGVVGSRQLEVGQNVGSGTPVIAIDGVGRELWVSLPANIHLQTGQNARLLTQQGPVNTRLLRLASRVDAGSAQRAVLSVPDDWRVGETLAVRLLLGEDSPVAVSIPLRAVQAASSPLGSDSVFRLKADNQTLERVSVRLGATHGDVVDVLSGLKSGDKVVVAGAHTLSDGTTVKPISALR